MLTLASNERIPLTPMMRLLFEISHLKTATPATVSRAGILYINPADLGWNPSVPLTSVRFIAAAFFCRSRYDVTDILSVTRHIVSHYVNSHISTQHRASVLLLLELLFVRERVLSCPLLSADAVDMFVDFICIS